MLKYKTIVLLNYNELLLEPLCRLIFAIYYYALTSLGAQFIKYCINIMYIDCFVIVSHNIA